MSRNKNILVISDAANTDQNYNVSDLIAALEAQNFVVTQNLMDGAQLKGIPRVAPKAVLLYFPIATPLPVARLSEKLSALYQDTQTAIIGVIDTPSEDVSAHIDSLMIAPVHHKQIVTRISSFIRLREMQTEFLARQETMEEHFGIKASDIDLDVETPLRILFIGKAAPEFMVLINALQDKSVKVIAAFTSFTAFDYLHDEDFDAVVINGLSNEEPAFTISSTMRRNSRLFHVPVIMLSTETTPVLVKKAHGKGISDILTCDAPPSDISNRVLELARYHKAHTALKTAFGQLGNSEILDLQTGLFVPEFFNYHSQRLAETAEKSGNQLTLAMLTISTESHEAPSDESLRVACIQIGGMIKNLIRTQDSASWLGNQTFAVLCPGEQKDKIEGIAQRISTILRETAFDSDEGPFRIKVDYTLADLNPNAARGAIKDAASEQLRSKA